MLHHRLPSHLSQTHAGMNTHKIGFLKLTQHTVTSPLPMKLSLDWCIPRLPSQPLLLKECKNLGIFFYSDWRRVSWVELEGNTYHIIILMTLPIVICLCQYSIQLSQSNTWQTLKLHRHEWWISPHITQPFLYVKTVKLEYLHIYNLLQPWPPPPSSSNSLPFYLSHPFCSSFSLSVSLSCIASSLSLPGVSKQLKHLQGVTLGPHAPPKAVIAGGRRQRWKGERFIRLFSPPCSAWHRWRKCG